MQLGDNNIVFTINSNIRFFDIAAQKTIQSLNNAGIDDIKVIIGHANKNYDEGNLHYTTEDSCDYTTFNYIVDYPDKFSDYTHIFYIHDTCWVGTEFKDKFVELTPKSQVNGYLLTHYPSMNIGLYSIKYLLDNEDRVRTTRNLDISPEGLNKHKQYTATIEDCLNAKNGFYSQPGNEVITFENPYGTQTLRRVRHFPALDLYKSQSNWEGIKDEMNIDL